MTTIPEGEHCPCCIFATFSDRDEKVSLDLHNQDKLCPGSGLAHYLSSGITVVEHRQSSRQSPGIDSDHETITAIPQASVSRQSPGFETEHETATATPQASVSRQSPGFETKRETVTAIPQASVSRQSPGFNTERETVSAIPQASVSRQSPGFETEHETVTAIPQASVSSRVKSPSGLRDLPFAGLQRLLPSLKHKPSVSKVRTLAQVLDLILGL